jgi:hypothetical protein
MSTSTNQTVKVAPVEERYTPRLVNFDQHSNGGNVTFTVLFGDHYYTVPNAQPDFPAIDPDEKIEVTETPQLEARWKALCCIAPPGSNEQICEIQLLEALLHYATGLQVTFGSALKEWMSVLGLRGDIDQTNYSYYYALRTFTEAWLRVKKLVDQG